MRGRWIEGLGCIGAAAAFMLMPSGVQPAAADPVADFYKGRNVTLLIAHEVGTGYDIYGRTLARHIGRHIAGTPNIVVQNLLGASGITGANQLANTAPKDGSVIGMFAHTVPLDPLIGEGAARFDPSKFGWLGNMEESVGVCAVSDKAGVGSFADLKTKEVLFGASATTGPPSQMAAAARNLLGAKIKLVHGYKGAPGVKLAIESGEVAGICGMPMSTLTSQWAELIDKGRLAPVIQLSGAKGAVPGITYVYDLATSDEDARVFDLIFGILRLGKPVAAPPGIPADRLAALRAAFNATMQDDQFLADAARQKIEISPASAEAVAAFVARIYSTPKAAIERARVAVKYN